MNHMRTITWYYDIISPYAYLQSTKLSDFTDHALLKCKPILFAGLLKYWGQLGPAEIVPKRQWTFEQIAFLADRHNIALTMPAMHPFNPLPLLRIAQALELREQSSIATTQTLFNYVWRDGKLPTNESDFANLLQSFDLSHSDIDSSEVKAGLKQNTDEAIAAEIFGVPTSVIDGQRFWGFDAGEMLHSYLNDEAFWHSSALQSAQSLQQGKKRLIRD